MGTTRFFSGGRAPGARSIGNEIMRLEIQKKGKMPSADRFKYIFKQRMEENKKKALGGKKVGFSLPGSGKIKLGVSRRAEEAMKQIAAKKAAKEAKALRKMVFVQPRNFHNGNIVRNGTIYDIAGNVVAKVDTKNGVIKTGMGWSLGKYKPGSAMTNTNIVNAIDKYSPYYINLRKMQMMQQAQQGGVWGAPDAGGHAAHDVLNIYGRSATPSASYSDAGVYGDYSSDMAGPRQNVGATAWGAMSDNVFGTFTDNVWGTSSDTVWGTNTSDVWGGVGGSPFGNFAKTVRIWGSGNGHNYLRGLGARVAAFFGLNIKTKASRAEFHENVNRLRTSRTTRSGSHDSHVVTTRAPAAPTTRR